MADLPEPRPRMAMPVLYELQQRRMREAAEGAAEHAKGGQVRWSRPSAETPDPSDYEKFGDDFDRDDVNRLLVDSVKDPDSPGTVGDLVVGSLLLAELAEYEAAWRQRHYLDSLRADAWYASAKEAEGGVRGEPMQRLEYMRRLLNTNSPEDV